MPLHVKLCDGGVVGGSVKKVTSGESVCAVSWLVVEKREPADTRRWSLS